MSTTTTAPAADTTTAADATGTGTGRRKAAPAPRKTFAQLGRNVVKSYTERMELDGGTLSVRFAHRPDTPTAAALIELGRAKGVRFVKQYADALIGNDGKGGKETGEASGTLAVALLTDAVEMA